MSTEAPWQRLDPRRIAAKSAVILAAAVPVVLGVVVSGDDSRVPHVLIAAWAILVVLTCANSAIGWYTTWYRTTRDSFEFRTGLASRNHRSLPRDRIRSVDLTADAAHRVFGLSVVKIGTGSSAADQNLTLDALPHRRAEALHRELLNRESTSDTLEPDAEPVLARLKPVWLLYSVLTVWLFVVWGAMVSAANSLADVVRGLGLSGTVREQVERLPLWFALTLLLVVFFAVGLVGVLALSTEMWWNFRLTRGQDTLRVRRGLITTRSVSLEQRRLRGVEIAEPLLLRLGRGARTDAIATGLSAETEGNQPENTALLPPAPKAQAWRVTSAVLHTPPVNALSSHPRAALRRRITWGLATSAPLIAAFLAAGTLGWLPWAAVAPMVVVTAGGAVASGVDAYRSLGHQLTENHLITRSGTGVRRTVLLQRSGIVGWRIRQSPFQRRPGVLHIAATTAAGRGAYEIRDVATRDGLALADAAVPGLLAPFLERD